MKIFYWKIKKNFGDLLTSFLLHRFTGLKSEWAPPEEAQLVLCGSILEKLPWDFSGVIAGAGKLHENTVLHFPYAKILALRGPLTAKGLIDNKVNFVYGDPGLLANELVQITDKKYDLGIIPHWTDTTLEHDKRFTKYDPKVIRVGDDPLEVISEIGRCKKIVSSSLHGIILADSLGIPRRIELAPRMISHSHQEGGVFKWKDYHLSLNMDFKTGVLQEADRNVIADKQSELFDVFEQIKKIFSA